MLGMPPRPSSSRSWRCWMPWRARRGHTHSSRRGSSDLCWPCRGTAIGQTTLAKGRLLIVCLCVCLSLTPLQDCANPAELIINPPGPGPHLTPPLGCCPGTLGQTGTVGQQGCGGGGGQGSSPLYMTNYNRKQAELTQAFLFCFGPPFSFTWPLNWRSVCGHMNCSGEDPWTPVISLNQLTTGRLMPTPKPLLLTEKCLPTSREVQFNQGHHQYSLPGCIRHFCSHIRKIAQCAAWHCICSKLDVYLFGQCWKCDFNWGLVDGGMLTSPI